MHINDLPLPRALLLAMHEERWRCPIPAALRRVFRESPARAAFFDLATMREENRRWRDETDRAYLGRADEKTPPGDIDPTRSLLLGALGPEMPFALDYRTADAEPRVLYLHTGGDLWITVARDVDDLLARLRLDRFASAR